MLAASAPGLFCIALFASVLGGALGLASGIFIVPMLTIIAGINIHTAVGASIVSVIACSCSSAAPFLRSSLTNVRLAIVLEVATTLGALSGVLLSGAIPIAALYAIFAAVLLVSAWQMSRRRQPVLAIENSGEAGGGWTRRLDGTYRDRLAGRDVPYRIHRLPVGLGLMYAAGLLSALLGIGSGVLKIPAMDTALRLPIKVSSATSSFMIGVTAAASASAYLARGVIVPGIAGPVALGSVAGALLGARLLVFISAEKIRIVFVIVLLVLAAQMSLAACGIHPRFAR